MPYEWTDPTGPAAPDGVLHLWPYRSLLRRDMVIFLGATLALVGLPLLVLLGSSVLWGLLPFMLATILAIWWALERSFRDGAVLEELRLSRRRIRLERDNPRGPRQSWEADPHWVSVQLDAKGGPVDDYLTLKGGGREVELGAFLTADERRALHDELEERLAKLKGV